MLKFNSGQIISIVIAIFICGNYLASARILDDLDNKELLNWDRELSGRESYFHSEFDVCNDGIEKYLCGNESNDDNKLYPIKKHYFTLELEDFADEVLSHIDENDENVTKSEKRLKKFVQAHFNKDYEEQVKTLEIANSFGGWPIFNSEWNETDFSIAYVLGQLHGYGINSIFKINLFYSPDPDVNKSSLSIAFGDNTFFANRVYSLIEKYNLTIDESDSLNKETIAKEIEKFSSALSEEFEVSKEHESNPILLSEIIDEVEGFDWDIYLEALFDEPLYPNSTYVNIESVERLKKLVIFLNETQPRVIANYFLMCILYDVEEYVFDNIPTLFEISAITHIFSMKRNFNQIDQLIVADIQEDLDAIAEGKLKYVLSEKNYEIVNDFLNKEHQKAEEFKDFRNIFSDEYFDEYYDDYDIDPNNTIQNILSALRQDYLRKIKYENESALRADQEYFTNWLAKIEPIRKLPTVYYFSHYVFSIWYYSLLRIVEDIPSYSNASDCYGGHFEYANTNVLFNEALRLTYETYNLWLARNQEIADKENTTPFTNKQILLLIVDSHVCSTNRQVSKYLTNDNIHDYTDLWIEQFNCTDVVPSNETSCSLFD